MHRDMFGLGEHLPIRREHCCRTVDALLDVRRERCVAQHHAHVLSNTSYLVPGNLENDGVDILTHHVSSSDPFARTVATTPTSR